MTDPILQVRGLKKHYVLKSNSWLKKAPVLRAVDGVDLTIDKGETLGVVGESGCGKSTLGRMIAGIETPSEGTVLFQGQNFYDANMKTNKQMRMDLQMIFQDPYASLNPRMRVFDILAEPMIHHGLVTRKEARDKVLELLQEVGLNASAMDRYPHEFSGGQRQRISIARSLSLNPELIVCDEPVSALDVSIQAQILNLLKDLQKTRSVSYLFIAHGLPAVHYMSDRIAVMYLGKIVEIGDADSVFKTPLHPYSKMLIAAVPIADPEKRMDEKAVPMGEVLDLTKEYSGCRFKDRCPFACERCAKEEPELKDFGNGHSAACWNVEGVHE